MQKYIFVVLVLISTIAFKGECLFRYYKFFDFPLNILYLKRPCIIGIYCIKGVHVRVWDHRKTIFVTVTELGNSPPQRLTKGVTMIALCYDLYNVFGSVLGFELGSVPFCLDR